ncbi:inhibitor of KinA [Cognatiyoonia koreensis]|uniref:Inhibitor of KinA n=1 Tax=Cognatiyoonia koreensis TaxID=364200 RepID=A0A1I0S068_9RHOB|nr:allophanate hydrolase subunit 1 [Cognatiyoonia koreensis]SEW47275.1 inhibitor of KinA [Cognatiyoonia koreensis]
MDPQFTPIADHALLVSFAQDISDTAHAHVVALDKAIGADIPTGVIETVPALVNLLVSFDPVQTDHVTVQGHVRIRLKGLETKASAGVQRNVQVCYEPPFAPDLDAVASATGLTTEAVINAHLAGDFQVLMYGFAPGYAYLSGVQKQIQVPRKPKPVRDVPAGSVIIAGAQCLITTLTMPTGWSIIGGSPTPIFTGDPEHPFLFDVGDRVAFERIDTATYDRLDRDRDDG